MADDDEERAAPPATGPDAPPDPVAGRRLDDDEVRTVLARAGRGGAELDPGDATSVADLMEAAREAGLDPADVRRAARVEAPTGSPLTGVAFGAPDRRTVRAHVPGVGLPDARRELVHAAERGTGRSGTVVESTPDRFVWREDHGVGRTTVTLTRADDGTEVSVQADRAGHYLVAWFTALVVWAVAMTVLPLPGLLGPLGSTLSFLAVPLLAARPFWIRSDRALRGRLDDTIMGVLRVVEEDPSPPAIEPAEDASGA